MAGSKPRHGHKVLPAGSRTYQCWAGMLTRVRNPNRPTADRYIGRGIDMDPRWEDFAVFLADMGERPEGLTIERIDNDKGYWPENCCWATQAQQTANRECSLRVIHDGKEMLGIDAAVAIGATPGRFYHMRHPANGKKPKRSAQEALDHLIALRAKREARTR